MEIGVKQIQSKEVIGLYKGESVILLVTYGGYNVVGASQNGKFEVFGIGPNAPVAKFVAQKKYPDIQFKDLSKSEPAFISVQNMDVEIK